MVSEPVLVMKTPPVPPFAARFEIAVSIASPVPIPVAAMISRLVPVTLFEGPLLSLMAPAEVRVIVAATIVFRAVLESSVMSTMAPAALTVSDPKFAVAGESMRTFEADGPLNVARPTAVIVLPAPTTEMPVVVFAPFVPVTLSVDGDEMVPPPALSTETPKFPALAPVPPPVPVTLTAPPAEVI